MSGERVSKTLPLSRGKSARSALSTVGGIAGSLMFVICEDVTHKASHFAVSQKVSSQNVKF